MTDDVDYEDCGIEGRTSDPAHVGQINRMLRRIAVVHLKPLKTAARSMQDHVEECAKLQARIAGGIVVLQWLMGICIAVGTALLIAWATKVLHLGL